MASSVWNTRPKFKNWWIEFDLQITTGGDIDWGTGEVRWLVIRNGAVVYHQPEPGKMAEPITQTAACACKSAAPDPGTRRSGMLGVAATSRKGKHGRRALTLRGQLSRPRIHWRGDSSVLVTMDGRYHQVSSYAMRKAQWDHPLATAKHHAFTAFTAGAYQG